MTDYQISGWITEFHMIVIHLGDNVFTIKVTTAVTDILRKHFSSVVLQHSVIGIPLSAEQSILKTVTTYKIVAKINCELLCTFKHIYLCSRYEIYNYCRGLL